jgi:hypothetical protein
MDERAALRDAWGRTIANDGGHCPVCDRWGKVYLRNINVTMAQGLMWLCRQTGDEDGWINVPVVGPQWLVRSNQLATLHWWNLVERKSKDETHKAKFSGIWRPTALGKNFAAGLVRVPKSVYTYNNMVMRYSTEEVLISECLKEVFDYDQVMRESLDGSDT